MNDIEFPRILELEVPGSMSVPTLRMTACFNSVTTRYQINRVEIAHPLVPVTSTIVNELRLRSLTIKPLRAALREANPALLVHPPVKTFFRGTYARPRSMITLMDPSPALLTDAATVFTLARAIGEFPVQAVQHSCGIGYTDAKRWVRTLRRDRVLQ